VCGSSSWLVQVTVVPTGTVNVAGLNLKSVMATAVPPCGAGESAAVADAEAGGDGMPDMPGMAWPDMPGDCMPDMPGVMPDSKVIDGLVGVVSDAWLEHAVVSRMPAAASGNMVFTP
jgi:hypothetical protein